jgi:hypothetical protein
LRSGVVTQLGFLRRELWRRTLGKLIYGTEDVIKEHERSFDLEVMRGTSAASRLLIELPFLLGRFRGRGLRPPPMRLF